MKTHLANLPYLKVDNKYYFETDSLFHLAAVLAGRLDLIGEDGPTMVKISLARSLAYEIRSLINVLVYDKENYERMKIQIFELIREKFTAFEEIL